MNQSINQLLNQTINQSIDASIHRTIHQSINPLTHQSIDLIINRLLTSVQLNNKATPEEFENRGFTLKTHEMFSVRTTLEEQSPVILDLCLSEKAVLLDSSGLKSVFEKLGFRDELMRVEDGTNLRNKAVYSNIFGVG